MKRVFFIAVLATTVTTACGPQPRSPGLVDDLRVLAVRAEPAEAAPGETIALDALVADPHGNGRPVSMVWGVCVPDPVEGLASCSPETAEPIGFTPTLTYDVPADFLDGLEPEDQEVGLELFVVVLVSADAGAGREEEIAIKRVRVSTSSEPNLNPEILDVYLDGENPLDVEVELVDDEPLIATWLTDAGEFDHYLSWFDPTEEWGRARWQAAQATSGTAWMVFRDDRGGVVWYESPVGSP